MEVVWLRTRSNGRSPLNEHMSRLWNMIVPINPDVTQREI